MKQLLAFLASLFGAGKKKKPPVIIVPPVIVPAEYRLNWPDRRPIGMVMLANYVVYTGTDNYMFEDFTQAANNCIANLRAINAQGCIVWDGEGQRFPHSYTYIGDPTRSPEKVDPFFAAIKAAGFRIGVCLRPDEVRMTYNDEWKLELPYHYTVASPFENLVDKIEYARKRWGCTLFYVDSNIGVGVGVGVNNTGGYGNLLPASIFKELAKLYPDCLIIPEHQDNEYYLYTAPYNDKNYRHLLNADEKGFQVLNVAFDDAPTWSVDQLRESVKQGNILVGRVWYDSPEISLVKQAYNT